MNEKIYCKDCYYSEKEELVGHKNVRRCHKHAPFAHDSWFDPYFFPLVNDKDWCGEGIKNE